MISHSITFAGQVLWLFIFTDSIWQVIVLLLVDTAAWHSGIYTQETCMHQWQKWKPDQEEKQSNRDFPFKTQNVNFGRFNVHLGQ